MATSTTLKPDVWWRSRKQPRLAQPRKVRAQRHRWESGYGSPSPTDVFVRGVMDVLRGYANLNDDVNRAVVSAAPVYVRTLPALS